MFLNYFSVDSPLLHVVCYSNKFNQTFLKPIHCTFFEDFEVTDCAAIPIIQEILPLATGGSPVENLLDSYFQHSQERDSFFPTLVLTAMEDTINITEEKLMACRLPEVHHFFSTC